MSLFEIISLIGMFLATFGFALPWIISNDLIPLPIDILLFLLLSWVYGSITLYYYKRFYPAIKKLLKRLTNE